MNLYIALYHIHSNYKHNIYYQFLTPNYRNKQYIYRYKHQYIICIYNNISSIYYLHLHNTLQNKLLNNYRFILLILKDILTIHLSINQHWVLNIFNRFRDIVNKHYWYQRKIHYYNFINKYYPIRTNLLGIQYIDFN